MHKIGFALPTGLAVLLYHLYIRVASFRMQLRINYVGMVLFTLTFYILTAFLNNLQSGSLIGLTWVILCIQMYMSSTTLVDCSFIS